MDDPIKDAIDRRLAALHAPGKTAALPQKVKHHARRLSIPMIALLIFLLAGTAAAAPAIARLLGFLGDEYEPILQPVSGIVVEDCNVRMEVLAALSDAKYANIYIKLTDLVGGRLSEDMQISHDWPSGIRGWMSEITTFAYDESEQAVYLKIGGELFADTTEVSFVLHDLEGQRNEHRGYIVSDDLETIMTLPSFRQAQAEVVSFPELDGMPLYALAPDQLGLSVRGLSWLSLSNVGMIDGKLHVQTKWAPPAQNSTRTPRGSIYLAEKPNGTNHLQPSEQYSCRFDTAGNLDYCREMTGTIYHEDVFELPAGSSPDDYMILTDFKVFEQGIPGTWAATVQLEPHYEVRSAACQLQLADGSQIEEVILSPLGLTCKGAITSVLNDAISITLRDGSRLLVKESGYDSGSFNEYDPTGTMIHDQVRFNDAKLCQADGHEGWLRGPWPLEDAVSITINDETILFQ